MGRRSAGDTDGLVCKVVENENALGQWAGRGHGARVSVGAREPARLRGGLDALIEERLRPAIQSS